MADKLTTFMIRFSGNMRIVWACNWPVQGLLHLYLMTKALLSSKCGVVNLSDKLVAFRRHIGRSGESDTLIR